LVQPADWSTVGPRGHAVQFYSNDGHLLDLLTRFVGTALVTGDAALVVATDTHRDGLEKRLRARGFDIRVPRGEGRYIALDADATLASIMRAGKLDESLFRAALGGVFARLLRGDEPRRIAAFGEMVAVLWSQGKHESAIQLEQMWNALARDHAFSLCCAYPIAGFGNSHAAPFMKICAQHSHVFTVASTEGCVAVPPR
jgi:hypothetical protein